jgi:hypothetical protein
MNMIQNNTSHLISEQPCIDNFILRTSQHSPNNIDYVEPEESNYDPIPTDPEIEDDDNDDNDEEEEEDEDDDYVVEREDSEDSSSEDIDDELEKDYDGDKIIDRVVSHRDQYNSFIGLGEIHPTRSMHDTIDFAPTYNSLYESRVSADGPLVEHQTFKSKEHLQFAIFRWHIEKN